MTRSGRQRIDVLHILQLAAVWTLTARHSSALITEIGRDQPSLGVEEGDASFIRPFYEACVQVYSPLRQACTTPRNLESLAVHLHVST